MNQSCQEISSQAIDPKEVAEQELIKQKFKWTGGKLWDDQTEDDPDEGDLSEGYEEEKVPDEETQGKEVSGNGNANKGDVQIGENTANNKNVPMEIAGSKSKVQQSENCPSPLTTIDPNNSIPTLDPIPAEPIDPGDPCGEEEQQIVEKDGSVEKEKEITPVNNQNAEQLAKGVRQLICSRGLTSNRRRTQELVQNANTKSMQYGRRNSTYQELWDLLAISNKGSHQLHLKGVTNNTKEDANRILTLWLQQQYVGQNAYTPQYIGAGQYI
ncbi:hypothetical protein A4A49_27323 [Nicotiana attenuata]|uniref:Uncharacterized protein n=1 Tax=Nicotiana attenuata TaxID=49451 RepID=A0A314KH38_NICAT|nr:hypothetical protein A4A49_27323 [Nicotiana attenuata]